MTKLRTFEVASDFLVMEGRSVFDWHKDRAVQRSPAEPDFWFGNRTVFFAPPDDPAAQIAQAQRDVPDVAPSVITWDIPDLNPEVFRAALEAEGYEVETGVTLIGTQAARPGVPDCVQFREITRTADWQAVVELQTQIMVEEGYSPETIPPYMTSTFERRRKISNAGRGAWFGLFDGDLLVADMGVVWSPEIVRFQSVETRDTHRKRGLCSALLGEVSAFARAKTPKATQVIVSEANSPAARVYARAGFDVVEQVVSAVRNGE